MNVKSKISNYLSQILEQINQHAEKSGNPYELFGIFGLITYPLFYLIWVFIDAESYENLTLRLIAAFLCVPLIFKSKWHKKYLKYLPLYWYFTLCYCLPFLFTFLLLKNNFSLTWILNVMTVLVLSVLLLDIVELSIVLPLGILLGTIFYKLEGNALYLPQNTLVIFITYFAVVAFGALFAHKKELIRNEKLKTLRALAIDIAHELRTPLRAINLAADNIKYYLNDLIQAYKFAKGANFPIKDIRPSQFETLSSSLDDIESETNYSNTIINMILTNLEQTNVGSNDFQIGSIAHSIDEALRRYPFQSDERAMIQWNGKNDFNYLGQELLTIHILFNLLKNAIYYVRAAGKGDIKIWLTLGKTFNELHFRDTGKGIAPEILPKIFDLFFTKTYHGSGIGLAFCKNVMKRYGGKIECQSVEGEFAEFILSFPKLNESLPS